MKIAKLILSAKNRRVSVLLKECSIETTGLASRILRRSVAVRRFLWLIAREFQNGTSFKQGSNEPLHPLKVSDERGFQGIERYAVS